MLISSRNSSRTAIAAGACFLVFLLYTGHFFAFAARDGLCFPGETGRIAGNQASGAGALPRSSDEASPPVVSLDLWRPFSSVLNIISTSCVSTISILVFICIIYLAYAELAILFVALSVILSVQFAERKLSCELRLVHRHIGLIFEQKPKDVVIRRIADVNGIEFFSILGKSGEPTCRAYVALSPLQNKNNDISWINTEDAPSWRSDFLQEAHKIIENDFRDPKDQEIFVSFFPFDLDHMSPIQMTSVVGCRRWPYPWYDRLP